MRMLPRGLAILFVLGILGLLFLMPFSLAEPARERSYGQFVQDVSRGDVQEVVVSDRSLTAAYRSGERVLVYLPRDPAALLGVLLAEGVGVEFRRVGDGGGWGALFPIVLPLLLLGGLIWFMTGQGAGGGAGQVYSFGQSRAELYTPGEKRVTMRDVAGMPEVKEELAEVVDFLQSPERYRELGARIPKGVLLSGPPGTGKTLLARAVAGEAGVPFYAISGSDFVEIFAGVGAARVRDLFARARQNVPCIIFVDEIDAVGRRRGQSIGGGNDEREQTLNQLLVEMDGFGNHEGIIVVAATNRLDILDTAILRPGRFDRQIVVDPPDRQGRREILAVHALGKPLADDVDLDLIAGMTVGFTGADLANLLNEAALLAARRRKVHVGMTDIQAAQERAVAGGPSLRRTMAEAERVRVAVHEAGHVVVSRQLPGADPIAKVTITPRGRAQGYVMYRPMEDKNLYTRAEILDRIVSLLGGRAAEQLALGDVSTGAADDLERATGLARRMVAELGMSPEIGPVAVASGQGAVMAGSGRLPSNRTVSTVDSGVSQLVHEAYGRALALLCQQRQALDLVARALLERETLEGRELEELLAAY